jgi:hypothetical protein
MNADDQSLLKIQDGLANYVTTLISQQNHSALAVAAVMVKISLQIYRTVLSNEEFHVMVDEISARRDQICPLISARRDNKPLH